MITVITPTLPERSERLADLIGDIEAQTRPPDAHLIAVDYQRHGPSELRNQMARAADGRWLAFADDDDRLRAEHLDLLVTAGETRHADVVWSWCEVTGRDWSPERTTNLADLDRLNFIPITTLVRKSMFDMVGGFDLTDESEDHGLWVRIRDRGGRFVNVPRVTWTYQFHGTNRSLCG